MDKALYQELKDEMGRLKAEIRDVSSQVYKNNFSSTQVFNKDCIFNTRLRVPVYTVAPTVAEVGDLIVISGELYVCSSINPVVFTVVGTQT